MFEKTKTLLRACHFTENLNDYLSESESEDKDAEDNLLILQNKLNFDKMDSIKVLFIRFQEGHSSSLFSVLNTSILIALTNVSIKW